MPEFNDFVQQGVEQNVRNDGRHSEAYRTIGIQTGVLPQASGSARVRFGGTEVLAAAKVEIGVPSPDNPSCGMLQLAVECCACADPQFQGRGGEQIANSFARALERSMQAGPSGRGKSCWVIYVDSLIMDLDGNVLDALSLAIKAALADTSIPMVVVTAAEDPEDEPELELDDDPSKAVKLDVSRVPLMVSVSQVGKACAVDLTAEEEACTQATVQVAVTATGSVCGVTKSGNQGITPASLQEMLGLARRSGPQLHSALNTFLDKERGESQL